MAYPDKYNRQFSFTDDEIQHPSDKTPGDKIDIELDSLKIVTDAIIEASKLIQRSDGKLQNGSVGRAQLSAGLQTGMEPARAWATGTIYEVGDAVVEANGLYTCLVAHVAGVFGVDLGAGDWELLANYSSAVVAPGSITATELAAGAVIEGKLGGNSVSTAKIQDGAVTTTKIPDGAITTAKMQANSVTYGVVADRTVAPDKMYAVSPYVLFGRHSAGIGDLEQISLGDGLVFSGGSLKLDYATLAEAQAQTGHNTTHVMTPYLVWQMILSIMPIGMRIHWPANYEPGGWLHENGRQLSRTEYSALFNVIGTTFGAGDGSTTFNIPDSRGTFDRGVDAGRGLDPGRVLGSYQGDDIVSHTHAINSVFSSATLSTSAARTMTTTLDSQSGATGGGETRPKNLAYLPIIRFR